jgi:hypothetical protein
MLKGSRYTFSAAFWSFDHRLQSQFSMDLHFDTCKWKMGTIYLYLQKESDRKRVVEAGEGILVLKS